jgi:hypothetical protein
MSAIDTDCWLADEARYKRQYASHSEKTALSAAVALRARRFRTDAFLLGLICKPQREVLRGGTID